MNIEKIFEILPEFRPYIHYTGRLYKVLHHRVDGYTQYKEAGVCTRIIVWRLRRK